MVYKSTVQTSSVEQSVAHSENWRQLSSVTGRSVGRARANESTNWAKILPRAGMRRSLCWQITRGPWIEEKGDRSGVRVKEVSGGIQATVETVARRRGGTKVFCKHAGWNQRGRRIGSCASDEAHESRLLELDSLYGQREAMDEERRGSG